MSKKSSLSNIGVGLVSIAMMISSLEAQTVLSGDHVVEGDLEIGTDTQKGGLTIKGETGNAASPGIRVTGDGGVVFEGTNGGGVIPTEGPGTRMMWYPGKAAFRVGEFSASFGEPWIDQRIGFSSVAFGNSVATAAYSTGISGGEANGVGSVAIGGGVSYGDYATSMSNGFGLSYSSTAMSNGETYGAYSTAMSEGWAIGDYSIAGGYHVFSIAFRSVVFGSFNIHDINHESPNQWVETDPIFVVGNGTGELSDPPEIRNRNALVILKNGTIKIPKRQGDILMGEFGNLEP